MNEAWLDSGVFLSSKWASQMTTTVVLKVKRRNGGSSGCRCKGWLQEAGWKLKIGGEIGNDEGEMGSGLVRRVGTERRRGRCVCGWWLSTFFFQASSSPTGFFLKKKKYLSRQPSICPQFLIPTRFYVCFVYIRRQQCVNMPIKSVCFGIICVNFFTDVPKRIIPYVWKGSDIWHDRIARPQCHQP